MITEDELPDAPPRPARRLITRRSLIAGSAGLIGGATLSSSAVAGLAEAKTLRVTEYHISPPQWPLDRRLSITVIADLHAGGPNMGRAQIDRVIDTANALQSDLIVILGDYFATHRFITEIVPHPVWAAALARLQAPLGRFAILGNHDWWHDVNGTRAALAAAGIRLMENEARRIESNAGYFWLAGLGDQLAYPLGHNSFRGVDDLPGTLKQIRGDDPVILLAHEPDIFPEVPGRVALTLAGHTHGGQIRVPLVWPLLVPSGFGARFAYGHIVEDGRHMIVSGGLGTSKVPVRLGVPPEIVRITLGGSGLGPLPIG